MLCEEYKVTKVPMSPITRIIHYARSDTKFPQMKSYLLIYGRPANLTLRPHYTNEQLFTYLWMSHKSHYERFFEEDKTKTGEIL